MAIFADVYQTEIASIDLENGRMDVFGQDRHYRGRCFVVYTGDHYDALVMAPRTAASDDDSLDVTVFDAIADTAVTARMLAFVDQMRRQMAQVQRNVRTARGTRRGEPHPVGTRAQVLCGLSAYCPMLRCSRLATNNGSITSQSPAR